MGCVGRRFADGRWSRQVGLKEAGAWQGRQLHAWAYDCNASVWDGQGKEGTEEGMEGKEGRDFADGQIGWVGGWTDACWWPGGVVRNNDR